MFFLLYNIIFLNYSLFFLEENNSKVVLVRRKFLERTDDWVDKIFGGGCYRKVFVYEFGKKKLYRWEKMETKDCRDILEI